MGIGENEKAPLKWRWLGTDDFLEDQVSTENSDMGRDLKKRQNSVGHLERQAGFTALH
jgi:hypothetical protein